MLVQNGNVVYDINEDEKDIYLNKGYDIVDELGNVIIKAVPVDVGELRLAYIKHMEEIHKLQLEIEELKGKEVAPKKTTKK